MSGSSGQVKWERLINVLDEFEMNIVRSLLESHGIPVHIEHKEAGQYLSVIMGVSKFGIDLFVPGDKLEQAREILLVLEQGSDEDSGVNPQEDYEETPEE